MTQMLTAKQTLDAVIAAGGVKGRKPWWKILILGFYAGAYIAMGSALAILVAGGMPNSDPGIVKFMLGAVFPVGLFLVYTTGTELFTGNVMAMFAGILGGTATPKGLAKNWCVSYIGNFLGSLFLAYVIIYLSEIFDKDPWKSFLIAIAEKKTGASALAVFVKAIGCNWLVCLAVWNAMAGGSLLDKALGIYLPVAAFVTLGFEHCVANMFFIPLAMMYDSSITLSDFIFKNLIFATLGNIVAGVVFAACGPYFVMRTKLAAPAPVQNSVSLEPVDSEPEQPKTTV
eukprot:TRINITY_DN32789_c0_g1_i1.p1 TRINITY_DN32789_c0_g1~~TRINITY_DN32789_c0_g1_i1.p1  ORF type:complete len:286 (+),score=74.34 TRINITY_DN32789_c0_g1_i1:53-910(+)